MIVLFKDRKLYSKKIFMKQIILAVDIEVFQNAPKWTTIGIVLSKWPSGEIIDTLETGCMRGYNNVSTDKKLFWETHDAAYRYNINLCKNKRVYAEEDRISMFMKKWLTEYPNLYIISDNPSFDISMLQLIYQNHGSRQKHSPVPSIMIRNNVYYQPICTWSMKRTIQMTTGMKMKHINKDRTRDVFKKAHDQSGIRHTPLFDAFKITDEYFSMLDLFDYIDRYHK